MNVWDWIDEFYEQAIVNGDEQRVRLPEIHAEGYEFRETNPPQALAHFEEGAQLARQLREDWWVLFFEDWCVSACLFFLRDFSKVLDRAVKNALDMRKAQFDQFPMRLSIHRNLIHAYIGIDPEGYADQIEESLTHLEEITDPTSEDRYLILGSRREYALEQGNLELASRMASLSLQMADRDDDLHAAQHYSTFSYSGVCEIAWRQRDWVTLKAASHEGELTSRQCKLQMELSEFLLWQALVAAHEGNLEIADYLHRRARSRVRRLQMPPDRAYYDALTGYYELINDPERAFKARKRELRTLKGKGRFWYESRCQLQVCRLLADMGELTTKHLSKARKVIQRLKHPESYLQQLENLS